MELQAVQNIHATAAATSLQGGLDAARGAAERGDAERAAEGFEALLATMLVREMNKTLGEGFFGSGPGSDTFNGWFEEHLGRSLAEGDGLGLTESLRAALIQKGALEETS